MTGNVAQFKQLSGEVDAGSLRLESAAADRCVAACDEYIDVLDQTANMVQKEAFGTLRSGQQLAEKFVGLSDGSPGSLQDILSQHTAVATDMREVFFKAGAAYRESEDANQRAINAAGENS